MIRILHGMGILSFIILLFSFYLMLVSIPVIGSYMVMNHFWPNLPNILKSAPGIIVLGISYFIGKSDEDPNRLKLGSA